MCPATLERDSIRIRGHSTVNALPHPVPFARFPFLCDYSSPRRWRSNRQRMQFGHVPTRVRLQGIVRVVAVECGRVDRKEQEWEKLRPLRTLKWRGDPLLSLPPSPLCLSVFLFLPLFPSRIDLKGICSMDRMGGGGWGDDRVPISIGILSDVRCVLLRSLSRPLDVTLQPKNNIRY